MEPDCFCAICGVGIFQGQILADHKVFDFDGTLDYIELAHVECAKHDVAADYWQWDGKPEQIGATGT